MGGSGNGSSGNDEEESTGMALPESTGLVLPESTGAQEGEFYESGDAFLLVLSTVIAAETPLQYVATIVDENAGAARIELTPLSLNMGSTDEPRELLDDARSSHPIIVDADGTVSFVLEDFFVPAAANPITGSEIQASIGLTGQFIAPGRICGRMDGEITVPISLDLTGSTFGAISLDSADDSPLPSLSEVGC